MKPELKSCPFCGGRAYLARTGTHKHSSIVECESCGCCLETGEEGDQCGEAWNRREPAEPVAALNPIRIIEGLFRSNEKRNTDQPGFQHTEGWNAALMRAMDVIRANTPLPGACAKLKAAQATLERLGYTYNGGAEWKPPIGKPPAFVNETDPCPQCRPGVVCRTIACGRLKLKAIQTARKSQLERSLKTLLEEFTVCIVTDDGEELYDETSQRFVSKIIKEAEHHLCDSEKMPEPVKPMRDWTEDAHHENGNYQCKCVHCGEIFVGHKRRVVCKVCDKENTSNAAKGDIVGWLRRRADYPMVSIPGKLAGEIADHIESLSEKAPRDDEILLEYRHVKAQQDKGDYLLALCRELLAKYLEQHSKCSEVADIDYKAMYEQMCERCDSLDKALADERNAALDDAIAQCNALDNDENSEHYRAGALWCAERIKALKAKP